MYKALSDSGLGGSLLNDDLVEDFRRICSQAQVVQTICRCRCRYTDVDIDRCISAQ